MESWRLLAAAYCNCTSVLWNSRLISVQCSMQGEVCSALLAVFRNIASIIKVCRNLNLFCSEHMLFCRKSILCHDFAFFVVNLNPFFLHQDNHIQHATLLQFFIFLMYFLG